MDYDPEPVTAEIKVYHYRWVQLVIFCLFSVINFMQFMEYPIIANVVSEFYKVDSSSVDLAGLVFFIVYIILFLPISFLIEKYSLKVTAIVSTGATLLGNIIKIFGSNESSFYAIIIGQIFCAIGQTYILSIPSKFASVWFGSEEVSTACALAIFGMQLGSAFGALFPPLIVRKSESNDIIEDGLFNMSLIYAVTNGVILLLVILFFRSKPKLPPSRSQLQLLTQSDDDQSFFEYCKVAMRNKGFLLILLVFGVVLGLFNAFGIIVNTLYIEYFPDGEIDIGIITLVCIIAGGCVGSAIFGVVLDKTHQFKNTSLGVMICTCITYGIMVWSLVSQNRLATFFTIPIFGFFTLSLLVIGFEYVLEVTYPVPEAVSCSILNVAIYAFALIGTFILEAIIENFGQIASHSVVLIIFITCTLCCFVFPTELKRRDANLRTDAGVR